MRPIPVAFLVLACTICKPVFGQTADGQVTESSDSTRSRKTWVLATGLGLGTEKRNFNDDSGWARDFVLRLEAYFGRGLTEHLLLGVEYSDRAALSTFFAFFGSEITLQTITLAVSYFPAKTSGPYISIGSGYAWVSLERTSLFTATVSQEDEGIPIIGNVGYEWRVRDQGSLALELVVEHYEFGLDAFDSGQVYVIALKTRWYF